MMETILTLIILGMILQGVVALLDSVLGVLGVDEQLKAIPVVGANINIVYAYALVVISDMNGSSGAFGFGASAELFQLGRFGMDVATAFAILAFIPIKDAAVTALGKGFARGE